MGENLWVPESGAWGSKMNSSFTLRDKWWATPYDTGVPQYLDNPEPGSKKIQGSLDEVRISIEPSLYARRLDQVNGIILPQVEPLAVESHIITITADAISPQLVAREERQREKRAKLQENKSSSIQSITTSVQKPSSTVTSGERNILPEPTESAEPPLKRIRVQEKSEVLPEPKIDPPKSVLANSTTPILNKSDSVLVRLASGEVVFVSRELLNKFRGASQTLSSNYLTSTTTTSVNAANIRPQLNSTPSFIPHNIVRASGPNSATIGPVPNLPINASLSQALAHLGQNFSGSLPHHHQQVGVQARPNGIIRQVENPQNGRTFRFVKIRAYQGPPAAAGAPIGVQQQTVAAPPTDPSNVPVSRLSEQLVKIQHMPHHAVQVPNTSTPTHFSIATTHPSIASSQMAPQRTVVVSTPPRAPLPMPIHVAQQVRPSNFLSTNGLIPMHLTNQQQTHGPMKICIIQSPRKADGTPVSPGSATPGIFVMNPPQNGQQMNFEDVLKAISIQNAATTAASGLQQAMGSLPVPQQQPNMIQRNVVQRNIVLVNGHGMPPAPKVIPAETNGLVKSRVS